jgi:hypothetical protein
VIFDYPKRAETVNGLSPFNVTVTPKNGFGLYRLLLGEREEFGTPYLYIGTLRNGSGLSIKIPIQH